MTVALYKCTFTITITIVIIIIISSSSSSMYFKANVSAAAQDTIV